MSENPNRPGDWTRYSDLSDRERVYLRNRRNPAGGRLTAAIVLIGIGVLLFLGNLGILRIHNLWSFWPIAPLLVGIGHLAKGSDPRARVWGTILCVFGSVFLLINLGVIHMNTDDASWVFALILIAVGISALLSVISPHRHVHAPTDPAAPPNAQRPFSRRPAGFENTVNDFAVLANIKRRLDTLNFEGGNLTSFLGSIEIDMRTAAIANAERTVVVNVMAVFGAIKIRTPREWRVLVSGNSVLGNFEDKTLPPVSGREAPSFIIAGWSVFGSVEIVD